MAHIYVTTSETRLESKEVVLLLRIEMKQLEQFLSKQLKALLYLGMPF